MNYVERKLELIKDEGFMQRYHETVYIGLRRCPKCGGSAHTKEINIDDMPVEQRWDYIDAGDDFHIVECEQCGRKTKPFMTIEGAVTEWNDKMR